MKDIINGEEKTWDNQRNTSVKSGRFRVGKGGLLLDEGLFRVLQGRGSNGEGRACPKKGKGDGSSEDDRLRLKEKGLDGGVCHWLSGRFEN